MCFRLWQARHEARLVISLQKLGVPKDCLQALNETDAQEQGIATGRQSCRLRCISGHWYGLTTIGSMKDVAYGSSSSRWIEDRVSKSGSLEVLQGRVHAAK